MREIPECEEGERELHHTEQAGDDLPARCDVFLRSGHGVPFARLTILLLEATRRTCG